MSSAREGARAALPVVALFAALGALGLAVHLAFAVGTGSHSAAVEDWLYGLLFAATAVSCVWRAARVPEERVPWLIAAAGVAVWLVAEVVYRVVESDPSAAYPPLTRALLVTAFVLAPRRSCCWPAVACRAWTPGCFSTG